jgi:hypothetical protein
VERVSRVVEGYRSFYEDQEAEDDNDQDGDEESDEDCDEGDGHHAPLPRKATANAGSPGPPP